MLQLRFRRDEIEIQETQHFLRIFPQTTPFSPFFEPHLILSLTPFAAAEEALLFVPISVPSHGSESFLKELPELHRNSSPVPR